MGDRYRPERNRPFSSGSYYQEPSLDDPEGRQQRDNRPYYSNDAGMNDRPLQFNGSHMSGNQANSQEMLDVYGGQPRYGPSHSGMTGMPNRPLMGHTGMQEIIHGNGYVVYPPDVAASTPLPSERPVGCKTVVLSDIPYKMTVEMVVDLCERVAGSVESYEMSRGPYCQVRFHDPGAIDRVFSVHGMRICVNNNKSPSFSGRLLVDYVQNPADLRDYEMEQHRIMRELRQEDENDESGVVEFSRPYIDEVTERIKGDNIAGGCVNILITWLERGYCTKRTASTFYRMISLTNSHVKRLQNEKMQVEEIFNQARQQYVASKGSIIMQLTLIEQVFTSSSKKKVWDHFTKAQRKSLDQWSQAVKALRSTEEKEIRPEEAGEADMDIDSEDEDERRWPTRQPKRDARPPRRPVVASEEVTEIIDLSDDEETVEQEENKPETEEGSLEKRQAAEPETEESPPGKKVKVSETVVSEKEVDEKEVADVAPVKKETETKSSEEQAEEAKPEPSSQSEAETNGTEAKEIAELRKENREIKIQLETLKKEEASMKEKETQIKALQLAFVNVQQQLKETKAKLKNEEESRKARESELTVNAASVGTDAEKATESSNDPEMSKNEGALMSFICIFLHAHPFGASIDYLYSYLSRLQPNIAHSEIDGILHRYPNCFVEELSGVGASLERRWKFVAFEDALKKS